MRRGPSTPVGRFLDLLIDLEARLDGRAQERMTSSVRLEAAGRGLEARGARSAALAFGEGGRALNRARGAYIEEGLALAATDRDARSRAAVEVVLTRYLSSTVAGEASAAVWSAIEAVEADLLARVTERRRAAS